MTSTIIVWDLETVPDLRRFAAANGLVGKTDAEIREALGDKFPKHIYHSIVCIGALIAQRDQAHWAVKSLGVPNVGDRTEKELIRTFVDRIAELSPQLVTYLLFAGRLSETDLRASERALIEFVSSQSNTKPHLNGAISEGR